jgi:hypothetical protein
LCMAKLLIIFTETTSPNDLLVYTTNICEVLYKKDEDLQTTAQTSFLEQFISHWLSSFRYDQNGQQLMVHPNC